MDSESNRLVLGYLELRKTVGILAVSLPFLLAGYCWIFGSSTGIQVSISRYYATDSRDLLVGVLCAIAVFMFVYKGYCRIDDRAGDLAAVSALGVALFPSNSGTSWVPWVHFIAALCLLVTLACFCIFLFTKTRAGGQRTAMKKRRDRVYYVCGALILACVALIGVYYTLLEGTRWIDDLKPVFWLESTAIWAFGVSWFVKGEGIFGD